MGLIRTASGVAPLRNPGCNVIAAMLIAAADPECRRQFSPTNAAPLCFRRLNTVSGGHVAPSKNTEREAREARERLKRYNARQAVHSHQMKRRKRDNLLAVGAVVVVASLATVAQVFYFNGGPGTPTPVPTASEAPVAEGENVGPVPDPGVSEGRTWTGELVLNEVALGISLDGAAAPQGVASFITDAQSGYFDGKTCHRLVSSPTAGLIQCGSVDGAGGSDPAYSFGPIENAAPDQVYPAGTIALARGGDNAYSQGHQFFIVFGDAQLPDDSAGGYSIIGSVTSGLDQLVTQIAGAGLTPVSSETDGTPVIPTTITRLTIQ
jgi:peptidyl-prolyl cis-trans isomerase B (cyclophilin B)